ncbi:DEAD-box type RNA helicase [Coemansia sp. RSA 2559]|nr:DEAD-box type RNA helicase [Coemansia sp. RSA 2559]
MAVRVYFDNSQAKSLLGRLFSGSRWEFCSIYVLTTAQREYSALQSMENMDKDLVKEILRPHTSLRRPEPSHAEVQRVMATYGLNQSQAKAIASATKLKHGFSLIQGPPGTGKTKTILCLACELLSASKASANAGEGEKNSSGPTAKSKLLICAHSNAAVDEITERLRNGIRDKSGATFYPRVVRLGRADYMSSTVKDISLEVLADKALLGSLESKSAAEEERRSNDQLRSILPGDRGKSQKGLRVPVSAIKSVGEKKREVEMSINSLYDELKKTSIEISELYADKARVDPNDASAVRSWKDKLQMAKQKRSNIAQEQAYMLLRKSEYIRESGIWTNDSPINMARKKILEEADIICSTLVGSGHDRAALLDLPFETVIIDEAAQSTEPTCLIPLRYGCKRCILVGDPNQLPPTVISKRALENLYSQSLFERIQKLEPQAVSALNIQYRMHPEISAFPSRQFYESRLLDGPDMAANRHAPWHDNIKYRPFQFFDIYSGKEQIVPSNSVYNMAEVTAAVQLVYNLCTDYPDLPWKQRIGVITTYNVQLEKLIEQFQTYFGDAITEAIEFNTVDGFQGQEKDVIIFSCVRAGDSGMGFLQDRHRMNVGLTRARKSLFVLGNADRLIVSPPWKELIGEAQARWLLRKGSLPLFGNPAKRGNIPKGLLRDVNEGNQSEFISKGGQQHSTTLVGSESTVTAAKVQAGG